MALVVVIEEDARTRASLVRLLRARGHGVDAYLDPRGAVDGIRGGNVDLLVASAGAGGVRARDLGEWIPLDSVGIPLIWTAREASDVDGLLVRGAQFLSLPADAGRLGAVVDRALPGLGGQSEWSGQTWLDKVDGPVEAFPPVRVLFLCHRIKATGRFQIEHPTASFSVDLKSGRFVGCEGLPGLLASLNVQGGPTDGLVALLGAAVAAGQPVDAALSAAGGGIGSALVNTIGLTGGRVWFDSAHPGPQPPMRLPESVARVLTGALTRDRDPEQIRITLGARRRERIRVRPPDDSPEAQWGLSSVALRLLRDGARVATFGELLGAAKGGEVPEVWSAVDLLLQFGLIRLEGAPRRAARLKDDAAAEASSVAGETPAPSRPAPSVTSPLGFAPPDAAPPSATAEAPQKSSRRRPPPKASDALAGVTGVDSSDPQVVELTDALDRMRGADPDVVLGIESSRQCSVGAINRLHIELAAKFHPDRFVDSGPVVRQLAEECFSLISEAKEVLDHEHIMVELEARLLANEEGRAYVSPPARRNAKLSFKKGELAYRKRRWGDAWKHLDAARTEDPTSWEYAFQAIKAGWRAEVISTDAAVVQLDALDGPRGKQRAEIEFEAGEMLVRAKREGDAFRRFERAVTADPDHIGARRRLRLRDMRSAETATEKSPARTSGLSLRGLLRWGRGGDGDDGKSRK